MPAIDPRKGFEALTYLFIRTHPSDDGSQPLPAGLPGWLSPDIAIVSHGNVPAPDPGIAVAQQVNVITVTVTNAGGIAANNAFVECFVCDPATGFTPATATPVGSGFLTIPGTQTATIQFNWTPQQSGHLCLLARVGLMFPPDVFQDPTVFDVYGDRHVAQRNLHVEEATGRSQQISFLVVNPFATARAFTLEAVDITLQKERLARGGDWQKRGVLAARQAVKALGLAMAEKPGVKGPALPPAGSPAKNEPLTLELKPHAAVRCVLAVQTDPALSRGEANLIEITQFDARTKRPVGGLTFVLAKRK